MPLDLKKWVFIDPQWNIIPVLKNIPLNAVEFKKAIKNQPDEIKINSEKNYIQWINPYLYYLNISFDNREGIDITINKVEGKVSLMLVPFGAKNPTIFQRKEKINYAIYTHSLRDFYAHP